MQDTKNLKKVAKREKTFATLARTEAKGARERAARETGAAKKDSQREVKIDEKFAKERTQWSENAREKLNKRS